MTRLQWIIVVVLFVVMTGYSTGFSVSRDDLNKINTKIEQTKKKISETKYKENSVLGNLLKNQQELERINDNIENLNSKLGTTEERLRIISSELDKAQTELGQIKTEIGGREGVLDVRLVAVYKYGYRNWLEVVLSSESYLDFLERVEMTAKYVRSDLHILQKLRDRQGTIIEKKAVISKKQQELAGQKIVYANLQSQHKQEKSRQLIIYQRNQGELATLQKNRKALEEALDELLQTSKEMEAQIRELQKQNASIANGSGLYRWPVNGRITSYFGFRVHPILRKRKYHTGIDIAALSGTPIVAADNGVVIFSGSNGGYGRMVIIDHGKEKATLYAHCSVLLVEPDQTVEKGRTIAKVGSTGLSTGPHLHFEIRKNGLPVDPLPYLPK